MLSNSLCDHLVVMCVFIACMQRWIVRASGAELNPLPACPLQVKMRPSFTLALAISLSLLSLSLPASALKAEPADPLLSALHNMPTSWKFGYNLGDLFNTPSFVGLWNPFGNRELVDAGKEVGRHLPRSIIGLYYNNVTAGKEHHWQRCREPNLARVRRAMLLAQMHHPHPSPHLVTLVRSPDTLVVHVRSGDKGQISEAYAHQTAHLSRNFSSVVLLGQVHGDKRYDTGDALKTLRGALHRLAGTLVLSRPGLQVAYGSSTADHDLYLMSEASHLLVHRGGFSSLAALLCRGNVFYTAEFGHGQLFQANGRVEPAHATFLSMIGKPQPLPPTLGSRTEWTAWFDLMGPVSPSCCVFSVFGVGDGEKAVCMNAPAFGGATTAGADCWIASIGSNGDFSFEDSVFRQTACQIHTFDCTGTWEVPKNLSSRVTLHPICVSDHTNGTYLTWDKIVARATNGKGTPPAYLKIDVEGWEYSVLPSLAKYPDVAPQQIAAEVHLVTYGQAVQNMVGGPWGKRPGTHLWHVEQSSFVTLMNTMYKGGYRLVSRQDNPYCTHCSEIVLLRDWLVDDQFDA